jgi:hypothetical protein
MSSLTRKRELERIGTLQVTEPTEERQCGSGDLVIGSSDDLRINRHIVWFSDRPIAR